MGSGHHSPEDSLAGGVGLHPPGLLDEGGGQQGGGETRGQEGPPAGDEVSVRPPDLGQAQQSGDEVTLGLLTSLLLHLARDLLREELAEQEREKAGC